MCQWRNVWKNRQPGYPSLFPASREKSKPYLIPLPAGLCFAVRGVPMALACTRSTRGLQRSRPTNSTVAKWSSKLLCTRAEEVADWLQYHWSRRYLHCGDAVCHELPCERLGCFQETQVRKSACRYESSSRGVLGVRPGTRSLVPVQEHSDEFKPCVRHELCDFCFSGLNTFGSQLSTNRRAPI